MDDWSTARHERRDFDVMHSTHSRSLSLRGRAGGEIFWWQNKSNTRQGEHEQMGSPSNVLLITAWSVGVVRLYAVNTKSAR